MTDATFAHRIAVALLDFALGGPRNVLCDALDGVIEREDARSWIMLRTGKSEERVTVRDLAQAVEGREVPRDDKPLFDAIRSFAKLARAQDELMDTMFEVSAHALSEEVLLRRRENKQLLGALLAPLEEYLG